MWLLSRLVGVAAAAATTGDTAAPIDTAALAVDDDDDGWTVGQGDCDDGRAAVNPGAPEACYDQVDNDCSGFADEQCDNTARLGSLKGGGACSGGSTVGGTAALLAPLALVRRRRLPPAGPR